MAAELQVTVFFFREGKDIIAFAPALELATCGRDEAHARRQFVKALDAYFRSLKKMGTVREALEELGWKRIPRAETWRPPTFKVPTHLLSRRDFHVPVPA